LEREIAGKPAGLRTHMLVAGAATLLVVLGDTIVARYGSSQFVEAIQADPIRIMEAIITGISFLGAGTIIFRDQKDTVEGLTTAASILFVASMGIAVALNRYYLAIILTILVIIILFVIGSLENWVEKIRQKVLSRKNSKN
ncbi:MAG: MgtC/SapB family protein, partial [Balneolaceae bacterium]|nr:MgtC/SapB family protein [Balneolaceae bacterium]